MRPVPDAFEDGAITGLVEGQERVGVTPCWGRSPVNWLLVLVATVAPSLTLRVALTAYTTRRPSALLHDHSPASVTAAPRSAPAPAQSAAPQRAEPATAGRWAGSAACELRSWPALAVRAPACGAARAWSPPTPRPTCTSTRALPEPGRLHVEPDRRPRHGHPRVHRLPVADGALLRGVLPPGVPVWVAQRLWLGLHPLRGRRRDPVPVPHPGSARAGARGGRAGLHALALLPAVRRAHLSDPAALGRPPVHARPDHLALRRGGGASRRSSPSSSRW